MAEPFKNLVNKKMIKAMALHFKQHWAPFDDKGFIKTASKNFDDLELKARTERITLTMIDYFPDDFEKAGEILLASLGTQLEDDLSAGQIDDNGISGWGVHSLTLYVGLQGHDHHDLSMTLLREMTKCASSEFDIRFFLIKSPRKTLKALKAWTKDDNQHVRRLASEGSRPRLPWAMKLPNFIEDPAPVIKLLETLKDDDKEYVRRSVANNLNDIAKDHPDLVADIAEKWIKNASKDRQRLVRHACRTLIKNGHKKTLKVLGYNKPNVKNAKLKINTPKVKFGNNLEFTFSIESAVKKEQALMIDYIVHHQKANGTTSPKVFKWKSMNLKDGQSLSADKKHPMRKVTTRVYYPGKHSLEIMVNGVSIAKADFNLLMP